VGASQQARWNRGCKSGAASLGLFLIVSVRLLARGSLLLSLATFGLMTVRSVVATAIGKIVGIVVDNLRLRIAVMSLTRIIRDGHAGVS
jgi:hypothetical protein